MHQTLDEAAVRAWAQLACDVLAEQRGDIDRINVFPVADGDTGSNLLATMRSGLDALTRLPSGGGLGACAEALARGALLGARGNSGVIVSQLLRGLAEGLRSAEPQVAGLVHGLHRAAELATAAVSEPVAGTILTVLQDAAAAAADAGGGAAASVSTVLDAAADAAARSLAATPGLLPVLARAGVVDAGARGLVVLLDTLAEVLTGRPCSVPAESGPVDPTRGTCASSVHRYEVMYLLEGCGEARADALRDGLRALGDCVVVAGSGGPDPVWSVHVHCSDVGAALEAGLGHGRASRITVLQFADPPGTPAAATGRRRILCLSSGPGIADLLRESGAASAPTDATADQIADAIANTGAAEVVVLVSDAEVDKSRRVADSITDRVVVIVPTRSAVQMLAALAVHDPGVRLADDLVAMAATGAATRSARLEVATQEALTWAGRCHPGDHLGVVDGDVVLVEPDAGTAAVRLMDRMLSAGGELVTVLLGSAVPAGIVDGLESHVRTEHPEVELVIYDGGQPDCVLLMGVE